jgi:hypothetical protein
MLVVAVQRVLPEDLMAEATAEQRVLALLLLVVVAVVHLM